MSFNLFEEIMYFTNRNEPDIIYKASLFRILLKILTRKP